MTYAALSNYKMIFLYDAIGAFLSAVFLLFTLLLFNEYFGLPRKILIFFIITASCLSSYATACFLFLKNQWRPYIRFIGIANLLYCITTIGSLIYYSSQVKPIELIYFLPKLILSLHGFLNQSSRYSYRFCPHGRLYAYAGFGRFQQEKSHHFQ